MSQETPFGNRPEGIKSKEDIEAQLRTALEAGNSLDDSAIRHLYMLWYQAYADSLNIKTSSSLEDIEFQLKQVEFCILGGKIEDAKLIFDSAGGQLAQEEYKNMQGTANNDLSDLLSRYSGLEGQLDVIEPPQWKPDNKEWDPDEDEDGGALV